MTTGSSLRKRSKLLRSRVLVTALVLARAVLFFSLATSSYASPPFSTVRLSEYQKQDWQVEDGLPENNVRMITQRTDGMLMLATSSGLATFDGQRFQSLPLEPGGLMENEAVNAVV